LAQSAFDFNDRLFTCSEPLQQSSLRLDDARGVAIRSASTASFGIFLGIGTSAS
jgi:hypothetical protein